MDKDQRIKELESQIEWLKKDMALMKEELKYLKRNELKL